MPTESMRTPDQVARSVRSMRRGDQAVVPAIVFTCRACGRVLGPGEGTRTCPDCGSRDIAAAADPERTVVLRRSC